MLETVQNGTRLDEEADFAVAASLGEALRRSEWLARVASPDTATATSLHTNVFSVGSYHLEFVQKPFGHR